MVAPAPGNLNVQIGGWLSFQSAKTKSPNPNSKMNSASRGRENALRFIEVCMPSGCGCVNGPVLSLLPLLVLVIAGTSKAQSKEDGLLSRGRAAARGEAKPRGSHRRPQYAPCIQGHAPMCPPLHTGGGGHLPACHGQVVCPTHAADRDCAPPIGRIHPGGVSGSGGPRMGSPA